jgi:tRNA (adenine-N(1)-)-methyltransferase non-catalytic subunit
MNVEKDEFYILKLPSGNSKIALMQGDVQLGKFGSFNADTLVGKRADCPYQITDNDLIQLPSNSLYDDYLALDNGANNQFISPDIKSTSQATQEFIAVTELKKNLDTKDLINALVDKNQSWSAKTGYSQAKYLKRKEEK